MSEQVVGGGSKSGNHMSKIAIIYTHIYGHCQQEANKTIITTRGTDP
jgi:hypothetical protein